MSLHLPTLIEDVFRPSSTDKVAILMDLPTDKSPDHENWAKRRVMGPEWAEVFKSMGLQFLGVFTYPATGSNGADLPATLQGESGPIETEALLQQATLVLAMTQFSATGPLSKAVARIKTLRVASMPGVTHGMQKTALAVNHQKLRARVKTATVLLNAATEGIVKFSTGHEMTFDLRFRKRATADAGECFADGEDRLINLPSGEAFIVPYEGELNGEPSKTTGQIPVKSVNRKADAKGELVIFHVEAGKIVQVEGDSAEAALWREFFTSDPARAHIAEFGLGCNDCAAVTGIVLEDEKAGFHWAYGRNEYFNDGHQGPEAFLSPQNVVHSDIVYAKGCPVEVASLILTTPVIKEDEQGNEYEVFDKIELIKDGSYLLW